MLRQHTRAHWPAIYVAHAILLTLGPALAWSATDDPVLAGRVVDPRGVPVVAARVVLLPWSAPSIGDREDPAGASSPAITDDEGRFLIRRRDLARVDALAGGRVRAWASKGGMTSGRRVLRPGSTEALDLRFELRESLDARVTVEREDGLRIAGVDVTLDLAELGTALGGAEELHYRIAVKTDEKGEARLLGLPVGVYGEAQALIRDGERVFTITQGGIALERRGESLRVRIVAPAVVRITGVLLENDGRPAEGLRVVDWSETGADRPWERLVAVDESGNFVLQNVPYTARTLLVCSRSHADSIDDMAARWPSVIEVVPLHLTPAGGTTALGQLRLPKRRTLRVRVTDGGQRTLRSRVMLQRTDVGFGATSRSVDASGWVDFHDVSRTGAYGIVVRADSPKWGEIEQRFPVAPNIDAQTVRVTGAGMLIVRFFSSAKPEQRVRLDRPTIRWTGAAMRSTMEMGKAEEVRMWVGAGESGRVEVLVSGSVRAASETVSTSREGPTVVDVAVKGA